MPTTSNFGWNTPADTDLVKDGALAIRTLGNNIDASMAELKGGTTGQVLSKTSNTDMDFTWVTTDDANAIQNAIVDAKGDLITATAADTPARLAVGNNGETIVADSAATTGLRWQGNYAAGKNAIINGDFRINQRSFTSNTANDAYNFDRFVQQNVGGTVTVTPQTFTAGTAPVTGYEAINFVRIATTGQSAAADFGALLQKIESVRTFANQTVTFSFWAKATSGTPKVAFEVLQNFGSGGSASVNTYGGQATLSTSWARYSLTVAVPSISGKTIGAGDFLGIRIYVSAGTNFDARTGTLGIQTNTFDFWGWQVEAGNVATAFQTATGTIQGETALCQRYYYRTTPGNDGRFFGISYNYNTTNGVMQVNFPVTMRVRPTALEQSGTAADYAIWRANTVAENLTSVPTYDGGTTSQMAVMAGATAGNLTANTMTPFVARNANAYLGWSAEL